MIPEPARAGTIVRKTVTYAGGRPIGYLYELDEDGKWYNGGKGAMLSIPYTWERLTKRAAPLEVAIELKIIAVAPAALLEDLATEILSEPENWLDVRHVGRWLKGLAANAGATP